MIIAIDREPLTEQSDLSRMLNGKANETVRLDVLASTTADPKDPKARRRVEVQATHRNRIQELMYERWCENNAKRVAELSGDKIGSLAITEPGGGSDVGNLTTKAVRDGDEYILNGAKTYITSGVRADYVVTAARTGGPGAAWRRHGQPIARARVFRAAA